MKNDHVAEPGPEGFELAALAREATRSAIEALHDRKRLSDVIHALSMLDDACEKTSLSEIVAEHLRRNVTRKTPARHVTLGEVFEMRLGLYAYEQKRSMESLEYACRYFCRRLGSATPVRSLDEGKIAAALAETENPATYNGLLRRFRLVLNWAVREGRIEASPIGTISPRHVPWTEPAYFTPDRVERVMRIVEVHPGPLSAAIGARLSMGFFAGVRTAEALRARWEDFDADGGVLRIPRPKGWTRGAKPRIVELEPNAVAWLQRWQDWAAESDPCGTARGLVVREAWRMREWKRRWLVPVGLSWGCRAVLGMDGNVAAENVMRHTYATMHVGAFRNAAATAVNLGHCNGTAMLENHYRGLVPRTIAEGHWRIMPGNAPLPPPEDPPGQGRRTDLYKASCEAENG